MVLQIAIALTVILGLLYYLLTKNFNYWEKQNVKSPKTVPLFGNIFESTIRKKSIGHVLKQAYQDFPKEKVVGIYRMTTPALLIRDVEVIKHIFIKDFDNFIDRGIEFGKDGLAKNLFHADGDTWRALRSRFAPIFTSSKLKNMMYLLDQRGNQFADYIRETIKINPEQELHILMQKYTMSTITATAFGLDIDTFRQEIETLRKIDKASFTVNLGYELDMMFPGVLKKLNLSYYPKFVNEFFIDLVRNVMKERNGVPSNRKDFMDCILELKNKKEVQYTKKFEDDKDGTVDITDSIMGAQAFLFYIAGYETSASTMGFLLYELVHHPEIQEKLRNEIQEYLKRNEGKITLDSLKELTYMDQVFDETLRRYPIVEVLQRNVQNDCTLPGTDVVVKKRQTMLISTLGLHHDEQYYPDPMKFDPERFTPEQVANRPPCAYIPFGAGPRHCIGMRFAMVQVRVCLIKMLSQFRLEPTKNTPARGCFDYDPCRVVLSPLGGFPVKVVPLN